jgi:alpha-L-fucosidase
MKINEEGIFGTRPWYVFGEGPTNSRGGMFNESSLEYTPEDMRFTTKEGNLYVYLLAKPTGPITVKSLANGAKHSQAVAAVTLLGSEEKLNWKQTEAGLVIEKPAKMAEQTVAAFKVRFE